MNRKVLSIGTVGVLAALLTAVVVPTPAQAAVISDRGTVASDHGTPIQVTAPPAPAGARSAATASVPSPTISPATSVTHAPPGGTYTCNTGNLCIQVWDPNFLWVFGDGTSRLGVWKIFYLYTCHMYGMYNWLGNGYYLDNQTPAGPNGVKSWFLGWLGLPIGDPITPDGIQHPHNWDLVWYIDNCR